MKRVLLLLCIVSVLSSCDNYGKKIAIKKSEVYYKDGASEQEAKSLGDWLLKSGWFDETTTHSAQLTKDGDVFVVHLVVDPKKLGDDKAMVMNLWAMQSVVSEGAFNGAATRIVLADEKLKDLKQLDPVATYKPDDKTAVLYNSTAFKKADAKKLIDLLAKQGMMDNNSEKQIFITKEDGTNVVRFIVDKANIEKNVDAFMPTYRKVLYALQQDVFDGGKTTLYLTSGEYEDFKKVPAVTKEQSEQLQQPAEDNKTTTTNNVEEPPADTTRANQ